MTAKAPMESLQRRAAVQRKALRSMIDAEPLGQKRNYLVRRLHKLEAAVEFLEAVGH